jgi:hypothetical protein
MNITTHKAVLSALEDRASRYQTRGRLPSLDERLYSSALDETGTVGIHQCVEDSVDVTWTSESERLALIKQQEQLNLREKGIINDVQRIHGVLPASKGEGVTRIMYENANGINNRMCNNDKVEKAKELINDLEVDLVAYTEHRLNMRHKLNRNGFSQLF